MEGFRVLSPLPGVYHIEWIGGDVFVTLLTGAHRALLTDTGLGLGDLAGQIRELTDLPLTVLNTHAHNDHIAGNYQFPEALLHPDDLPYARLAVEDLIKDRVEDLLRPAPDRFDRAAWRAYRLENLQTLEEDAVFDLGGLTARIVPLRTHSPGSMGIYVPERSLLLTGDCLAPMMYLFFPESSSRRALLERIDALDALPFRHMLASHCERLLPREDLALYRACVASYDGAKGHRYRDPFFPQYRGRLYTYTRSDDPAQLAFLIGKEEDRESLQETATTHYEGGF